MNSLLHLVEQYGLTIVFFNVLVEQLGAPLPAYPTLVITGALLEQWQFGAFATAHRRACRINRRFHVVSGGKTLWPKGNGDPLPYFTVTGLMREAD